MTRAVQTHPIYLVESVGDGDTITVIVDLGADVLRRARLRLVIVDCPERDEPVRWALARAHTAGWLADFGGNLSVDLQLTRTGRIVETFGRYLADVYATSTGESLSAALLASGNAEVWT